MTWLPALPRWALWFAVWLALSPLIALAWSLWCACRRPRTTTRAITGGAVGIQLERTRPPLTLIRGGGR